MTHLLLGMQRRVLHFYFYERLAATRIEISSRSDQKIYNNNNNNNNIVICKAHKVGSKAESEAPAVARWAALVGYAKNNNNNNSTCIYKSLEIM